MEKKHILIIFVLIGLIVLGLFWLLFQRKTFMDPVSHYLQSQVFLQKEGVICNIFGSGLVTKEENNWVGGQIEIRCGNVNKTDDPEVKILLEELKEITNIPFSEIEDVDFEWSNEQSQKVIMKGKGFEVKSVSRKYQTQINDFFGDRGFMILAYVVHPVGTALASSGEGGSQVFYIKDEIVCNIIGKTNIDNEEPILPETSGQIEVRCGNVNNVDSPIIKALLEDLKVITNIPFSEIKDVDFEEKDGKMIEGKGFLVDSMSRDYQTVIKDFFDGKEFIMK